VSHERWQKWNPVVSDDTIRCGHEFCGTLTRVTVNCTSELQTHPLIRQDAPQHEDCKHLTLTKKTPRWTGHWPQNNLNLKYSVCVQCHTVGFWCVMFLNGGYQHFGGIMYSQRKAFLLAACLAHSLTSKMDALHFSEMWVRFCQTMCPISEECVILINLTTMETRDLKYMWLSWYVTSFKCHELHRCCHFCHTSQDLLAVSVVYHFDSVMSFTGACGSILVIHARRSWVWDPMR
jgi:hypothetical protein